MNEKTSHKRKHVSAVTTQATAPVPTADDDEAIHILIVDDEPKNLTVLETILDDPSYRLVRAESADQALLALVTYEFALLILDIRMPDLTGFELAQLIKQRKKTADVPIIFLAAYYNEDQHVLEGYGSGAVDYLHKPVNAAILRSKVAVFAELHRKSRACNIANTALLAEVTERRRAQAQLSELNATLEQRVAERTDALKRTNVALHETGERYRNLFNSIDEGFFVIDMIFDADEKPVDYRFLEVNPSFENQTGMRNVTGKRVRETHPDLEEHWFETYGKVALTGEPVRFVNHAKTIECRWFDLYAFRVGGPDSRKVAVLFTNITERKQYELNLNNAIADAEKANRAKSDFLSHMSHDLRTPLNAILGFAQLIDTGPQPPTPSQKKSLNHILTAGWYLLALIDDILDLAKIESGTLSLTLEPVSLSETMQACLAMVEREALQNGIVVTFHPLETPCFVQADRTRLKQALINLLSNAVKYNKADGTVVVSYIERPSGHIRISVTDVGAGLSPEKLTQMFQPFNRLGQETGTVQGTGIGLAVTRQLVELMGGTIGVESTVGVGSEFWIELIRDATPQLDTGNAAFTELLTSELPFRLQAPLVIEAVLPVDPAFAK